jgi:hypothetical protein
MKRCEGNWNIRRKVSHKVDNSTPLLPPSWTQPNVLSPKLDRNKGGQVIITGLVQLWADGIIANYGLIIVSDRKVARRAKIKTKSPEST